MKCEIAVWISLGGLLSGSAYALPHSDVKPRDTTLASNALGGPLATRETMPSASTENHRMPGGAELVETTIQARVEDVTDFSDEVFDESNEKRDQSSKGCNYCTIM